MIAQHVRRVSPFGLWPDRPSAIRGLYEAKGAIDDTTYVFHSDYVTTRAGTITFFGRFDNFRATKGDLSLTVRAMPYDSERVARAKRIRLSLAAIAADDGRWQVTLPARSGRYHAIVGRIVGETDAAASNLTIDLDGWGDGTVHRDGMLRARDTVFDRGSRIGRSLWRRTSPVDIGGLISTAPATIADPSSQMCTGNQMEEPVYQDWLTKLGMEEHRHRKQWEVVYILAVLEAQVVLKPGARGLGFGCGMEPMPSYFAARDCIVLATDLPLDHQHLTGWLNTNQHASAVDQMLWPSLCSQAVFRERVSFQPVDMTAIPADLTGFDFCWSACAFEHLGSIAAGLRFIHDSVGCLRPGGVAVHTTELNLSSDTDTVDNTSTVLFRRRDMEQLALDLTAAGHRVLPLKYDPGDRPLDTHIDVPPYAENDHLKIALGKFVTTSFGIAVIRGQ